MSDKPDNSSDASEAEVFEALGHPTRIRLLQILAEKPLAFSGLKRAAGLESNGLLTFHLGRLRGLVRSDADGSYVLTDEGREALRMIEATRAPHSESWPPRVVFHPFKQRALVVGLVLLIVGLIFVGAFLGNAYVNGANTISSLRERNSNLEAHSSIANATIATDNAEIAAYGVRIQELQANLSSLLLQISQYNSTIQSMGGQVKLLETQVASLKSQVSSLRAGCGQVITATTTLDKDIGPCSYGDGLIVGASNLVLDCAGHWINGTSSGNGTAGIRVTGVSKVTIKNCFVSGFQSAFLLNGSSGNTLSMNTAKHDTFGFVLNGSSSNSLKGNIASNDEDSFDITSSSSNLLVTNTAVNDFYGFALLRSSNNTLSKDTSSNNSRYGFGLWYASFNTFANDTAIGDHLCGFFLKGSDYNNTFGRDTAEGNIGDGFYTSGSAQNVLSGNTAKGNVAYGYEDFSTGSGTSGTGNVYSADVCNNNGEGESDPLGLCSS
jgi:parallel beta-helix repeat protein